MKQKYNTEKYVVSDFNQLTFIFQIKTENDSSGRNKTFFVYV